MFDIHEKCKLQNPVFYMVCFSEENGELFTSIKRRDWEDMPKRRSTVIWLVRL